LKHRGTEDTEKAESRGQRAEGEGEGEEEEGRRLIYAEG
jgi:hypothetical protein